MFKRTETRPIHLIESLGKTSEACHVGLILIYEKPNDKLGAIQICACSDCENHGNARDNWSKTRFVDGPSEVDLECHHRDAVRPTFFSTGKPERTTYIIKEIRISRSHQKEH